MTKTKKIAIGLLSTFGVSLLVSAPLLILSSTKNNHEVTNIQNSTQRYKLSNWLIETKNDIELLSYFFSVNDINSSKIKFSEKNIDKLKVKNFFKRILFDIFKYSEEDNKIELKINYEINDLQNECKLNLNWHFVNKKQNNILKNIKYYDILMLYF